MKETYEHDGKVYQVEQGGDCRDCAGFNNAPLCGDFECLDFDEDRDVYLVEVVDESFDYGC